VLSHHTKKETETGDTLKDNSTGKFFCLGATPRTVGPVNVVQVLQCALSSALVGGACLASRFVCFIPGKYLLELIRRAGWVPEQLWTLQRKESLNSAVRKRIPAVRAAGP
jgi:hypothetical protein